ncbi:MAG: hypothetical protein H6605_03935 [Flavobacteriales bacterium]|nr:hypothetical protein [Flavobacteriales bacterium]
MKKGNSANLPLSPKITLELNVQPEHNLFERYLSFENYQGKFKRLKVSFKKQSGLIWESSGFPDGISILESLVNPGNRSYWDKMYFENRGGTTRLDIKSLKIVMVYADPAGSSPHGSALIVNGLDLSKVNHAEIPMVDWPINMILLEGYDAIDLNEFRKRSLHKWGGLINGDHALVRQAIEDFGKSGSDGTDEFGSNPKYNPDLDNLCTEFVTWYYYENNIKVNGKSVRDVHYGQQLREMFEAAGKLYRYNSGNNLQGFVHAVTGEKYTPKAGDYLERRGPEGSEHSMILYRWLPKDLSSPKSDDHQNQALVINGPWPVTLRLVKVHKDETASGDGLPKDYWLGRID